MTLLETVVNWLLTAGVRILVIVLVAALAQALTVWLVRKLFRSLLSGSTKLTAAAGVMIRRDLSPGEIARNRREQRVKTLSTVTRNVATVVIWTIATIMILDVLGVNIAPVIASLGVAGLAAGIGAQNIIKDVIAGVLMLIEDTVSVGDQVDMQYASGVVENINLRVTQVRADDGTLWTVRNGEVIRVGNHSRGSVRASVEVNVGVDAEDSQVTEILCQVARAFQDDPEWKDLLQGQVAVSGILGSDSDHSRRRLHVQVNPGKQEAAETELRRRSRLAFADAGITATFPLPEVSAAT
jgi:small conductance mechanosensitive channel